MRLKPLPDTRTSGVILVLAGLATSGLVHVLSLQQDRPFVEVFPLAGAALVAVGAAKLIHGTRVQIGKLTPLMRRYAVAAAVAGLGHLLLAGFFRFAGPFDGVVILLIAGLLCFGRPREHRGAQQAGSGEGSVAQ